MLRAADIIILSAGAARAVRPVRVRPWPCYSQIGGVASSFPRMLLEECERLEKLTAAILV